jgi:calcineurin-like phosphoesterase family protein
MDDTYLVEIRLARTKWRIKRTIFSIARAFSSRKFMERHPHVTLYGPLVLNPGIEEGELLAVVEEAGSRFGTIPFTISAWEKKEGLHGSVIAFSVIPSQDLREITRAIAHRLAPICTSLNGWDSDPGQKWFHVTVANNLDRQKASDMFPVLTSSPAPGGYPEKKPAGVLPGFLFSLHRLLSVGKPRPFRPVLIDETGLRITVMHGEEILAEYDLTGKSWITGDDVSSPGPWKKTLGQFRKQAGFELADVKPSDPGDIFVIADLHCGHANIIKYCCRPFPHTGVREMDSVLINNWNLTIPLENDVYFLGDLCYGNDAYPPEYYLDRLNGHITLIQGNHDPWIPGVLESTILDYGPFRFLLVHDPSDAPVDFNGWIIHGHHHNNNLAEFPFINFERRRINVSAEVVGYAPVSLRELAARINEGVENGMTSPVHLRSHSR